MFNYKTKGVCATEINLDVDNNKIKFVEFTKGCNGNLKGLSSLLIGLDVDEAINKLEGITCGPRSTSCPDQLSLALKAYLKG